jgi:hypothetical protein
MIAAVGMIGQISRTACREDCVRRFGSDAVVDAYSALYARLSARTSLAQGAATL